jgi:O-antigen biosynthesis protein
MRRDTYEHVGPLDERFKVGMFEDDDYSRRVRAAGRRVVCAADVFVHHVGQAAFRTLIRNREYDALFEYNRRAYEQKWNVQWRPHEHAPLAFSRSSPVVPVALQRGQR